MSNVLLHWRNEDGKLYFKSGGTISITRGCNIPTCKGFTQKVRLLSSLRCFAAPQRKQPFLDGSHFQTSLVKRTNVPPLLVNFASSEKFFDSLDSETRAEFAEEITRLLAAGLPPAVSTRTLATLFGYRSQFLGAIQRRRERYYRVFTIRKGKRVRTIFAPKVALKIIQRWLGFYLSHALTLPEYVVGFVPGKSTFDGAFPHCKAEWLFSTDIENFFPSTKESLVAHSLKRYGYSNRAASLIAALSSINGGLAQGSPASPVLSNIAFGPADESIAQLCKARGYRYTRYADDISISGLGKPPSDLSEAVQAIVSDFGWSISAGKTKLAIAPSRMKVFGLIVNGKHPVLTKGYRNRIRAIEHLRKEGRLDPARTFEGLGHLSYARSIEQRIKLL